MGHKGPNFTYFPMLASPGSPNTPNHGVAIWGLRDRFLKKGVQMGYLAFSKRWVWKYGVKPFLL